MTRLWYRFRCWLRDYCPKHEHYKKYSLYGGGSFCDDCQSEKRDRRVRSAAHFAQWAKENKPR